MTATRKAAGIHALIDLWIIDRRDGLLAREATPIGAVVLARGATSHYWYVCHNGKIHYKGNDPDRAAYLYNLVLEAAKEPHALCAYHSRYRGHPLSGCGCAHRILDGSCKHLNET